MPALNRLTAPLALALASVASLPALANEPRYNQVSLHAEVSQEVAHDRMYVTLYSESQDKDPARLASSTTAALNKALEQARQAKEVKVSLGSRNSYPVYTDEGSKIDAWRERAELHLESSDFASLAQLSAKLLGELKMAEMNFAVAEDTRKSSENALIKKAIEAFKARAELTTAAMGGKGYKLVKLSLNGGNLQPVYPMRAMAMDTGFNSKSGSTLQIEAGTRYIQLSANGTIEVQMP